MSEEIVKTCDTCNNTDGSYEPINYTRCNKCQELESDYDIAYPLWRLSQCPAPMPTNHLLKCWPEYFQSIKDGVKRFEYRLNDRSFKVHDVLELAEWTPELQAYTGRRLYCRVDYILESDNLRGASCQLQLWEVPISQAFIDELLESGYNYYCSGGPQMCCFRMYKELQDRCDCGARLKSIKTGRVIRMKVGI